jgi:tol-pal system protein YbgF
MPRWFTLIAAFVAPVAVLGAAPVVDQSFPTTGTRAAVPAVGETAALRKMQADLTLENEQLRNELRELRGQIEVQTHELESLKTRNREALADADKRLRELERRAAPAAESVGKPAAVAPSAAEQEEYQAAFNLVKQGYYEKAGKSFREFIAKHPSSELAGNAQYYIGWAQYSVRNFKPALEELTKVVDKYPSSAKVPDALLMIGYTHHELGALDKARVVLQQVVSRYPNTTTAKSAEKRLADIKAAESKSKGAEPKSGNTKK